MKTLQEIIESNYSKIGYVRYYEEPTSVINGWFGEIKNVVVYVELLGLVNTSRVIAELRNLGLNLKIYGLDIYIIQ